MTQRCGNCYFSAPYADDPGTGSCRFNPPVIHHLNDGRLNGSFPPVSLEHGWCGKWHWRWFGWYRSRR